MIATVLGQLLIGWLITDFLSGVAHWWEDRVGRRDWPVIGRIVVVPNREHHRVPLAFLRARLWKRNRAVWLVAGLISITWLLLLGPSWTWASATIGGLVVGEVHGLAHRPPRPGSWPGILQQIGLIQSPPHHAGHHRAPSDRRYCILTDWLNPVLDRVGFWVALETALTCIGLEPNRGTA